MRVTECGELDTAAVSTRVHTVIVVPETVQHNVAIFEPLVAERRNLSVSNLVIDVYELAVICTHARTSVTSVHKLRVFDATVPTLALKSRTPDDAKINATLFVSIPTHETDEST